ncbi:hypothetical protein [Mycobacterium leprae]|nr:hypothetical protein [Mycobacterium leprae]
MHEYEEEVGHKMLDDFSEWELGHRAVLSKAIYGFENFGCELEKVSVRA